MTLSRIALFGWLCLFGTVGLWSLYLTDSNCSGSLILKFIFQEGYFRQFISRIQTRWRGTKDSVDVNSLGSVEKDLACQFPVLDPWDKTIMHHIGHPKPFNCYPIQPYLTWLDDQGFIHLNQSAVEKSEKRFGSEVTCQWRGMDCSGGKNDDYVSYTDPIVMNGTPFQSPYDQTEVRCFQETEEIYYNFHVHPTDRFKIPIPPTRKELSFLLFGIDSTSLSLFRRHLPKTYAYLTEVMKIHIFHGHTKIADNSFPNMVPILTGLRIWDQQPDMPDEGKWNYWKEFYDDLPLIWKNFSRKGYVTTFIEEQVNWGLFHYLMKGFRKKPTDYYFRPYFSLVQKDQFMKQKSEWQCWSHEIKVAKQCDIMKRLLKKYSWKQRLFSYFFHSELSHDYEAYVEMADPVFHDFFKEMHGGGYFDDTVLIVMGDHGHRMAALRSTQVGQLEERMPFFSMWFPPWFYEEYPHLKPNIQANQWRLTAHFDIHETIKDVLNSNYQGSQRPLTDRGLSLFYPIPKNRTCQAAGIPDQYCVCTQSESMPINHPNVTNAALFLIDHVNNLLIRYKSKCAKLSLKKVLHAESYGLNQLVIKGVRYYNASLWNATKAGQNVDASVVKMIRVTVEADPSGALLESLVNLNTDSNLFDIRNDVDRINRYGSQSECIFNKILRKYCYCKSQIRLR